jgi:nucleotide-binding universal stress UspA family protein
MWDMTPKKILVAVESADCDAALELAASEARHRGCGVHLVHVNQPAFGSASAADAVSVIADQMQRIGAAVLNDAGAKLEVLLVDDELPVSTELCHGAVIPTLVTESAHACLVIMQHRGMGTDGNTAVMSMVNGVAARAHVPVIAVPSSWRPDAAVESVVTVGVENVAISAEVVRVAVEEAARSAAQLRLVHAFTPTETGDANLNRAAAEQEARRQELELSHAYAEQVLDGPEILIGVVAVPAPPAQALLEQASGSTLLIVGRRHPRLPIVSHLGPITRAVLRWSPVPVMVVDPVTPQDIHTPARELSHVTIP